MGIADRLKQEAKRKKEEAKEEKRKQEEKTRAQIDRMVEQKRQEKPRLARAENVDGGIF